MTDVVVTLPGKVMLAGEYAVLRGERAFTATVGRRLRVRARDGRSDGVLDGSVTVSSDLWLTPRRVRPETAVEALVKEPLLHAVAAGRELTGLGDVTVAVDSELNPRWGVGSSSALRLGVLLAMDVLAESRKALATGEETDGGDEAGRPWRLAREALRLQRLAQGGVASGYDIAAQVAGGFTVFEDDGKSAEAPWPRTLESYGAEATTALAPLLHVYVGGKGAATGATTAATIAWLDEGTRWDELKKTSRALIDAFLAVVRRPGEPATKALITATAASRRVMAESPAAPAELLAKLAAVDGCDETWSFKTTGAGGEDALLVVGPAALLAPVETALAGSGWQRLDATLGVPGVTVETYRHDP
jgi:mevalonate kinase